MRPSKVFRCYRDLSKPGVLGDYTGCEIYEVFFFQKGPNPKVFNLYTLVVFGNLPSDDLSKPPQCLNPRPLDSLMPGYRVGVMYYSRPLAQFASFYCRYLRKGVWNVSGQVLLEQTSAILARQYVSSVASAPAAVNKVLKNNFFGGSYLIEHFDEEKRATAPWRENPEALADISEKIHRIIPLRIGSVSDRLGNIILQFPNLLVRSQFNVRRDDPSTVDCLLQTAMGYSIPSTLATMIISEGERGAYFHGFGAAPVSARATNIRIDQSIGNHRCILYDAASRLVLGDFNGGHIETIDLNMHLQHPEQRLVPTESGVRPVGLVNVTSSRVGATSDQSVSFWENERIFDEEKRDLENRLAFKQYGALTGRGRTEALSDLARLIGAHGKDGVWLWDPFLSAADLIETVFLCPFLGCEIRALGSTQGIKFGRWQRFATWLMGRKLSPEKLGRDRISRWMTDQKSKLDSLPGSAKLGLRIEYRLQQGSRGWPYHDRFLLFPNNGLRPQGWSLGTSINSIGAQHHILQEVSHPAYIITAFENLWNQLSAPSCQVWKNQ